LGNPSKSCNNIVGEKIEKYMVAHPDKFSAVVFGPADVLLVIPEEGFY
jgi:hypothetical protein